MNGVLQSFLMELQEANHTCVSGPGNLFLCDVCWEGLGTLSVVAWDMLCKGSPGACEEDFYL